MKIYLCNKLVKKHVYVSLAVCLIYLLVFCSKLISRDHLSWFDYGFLVFIPLTLLSFLELKQLPYIKIKDAFLYKKISFFYTKISLNDIKEVQKISNQLIIKGSKKQMTINLSYISDIDSQNLKRYLSVGFI